MRGSEKMAGSLFSYVDLEVRLPARFPLRKIRAVVNDALRSLDAEFDRPHAGEGRPSIAPGDPPDRSEPPLSSPDQFTAGSERMTYPRKRNRNAEVDFRGERRSNATHASTTDPEARLFKKPPGVGAMLCIMGYSLMENRSGPIVQADLTQAGGHAGRRAAIDMLRRHSPGSTRRLTLAADRADVVAEPRKMAVAPHAAQKSRHSAIDARTTRHPSYAKSRRRRKKIEDPFGWAKTVGGGA